jgi:transcriptional pleiotropic regulator of transition state genes
MKDTGIIRNMDDLGRIVVPREIRRTLCFSENQQLEVILDVLNDSVILKKHDDGVDLARHVDNLRRFVEGDSDKQRKNALIEKIDEIKAILENESR